MQISADGEAMVHHDFALGRLTLGSRLLAAMTAAGLKEVPFKATSSRQSIEPLNAGGENSTLVQVTLQVLKGGPYSSSNE